MGKYAGTSRLSCMNQARVCIQLGFVSDSQTATIMSLTGARFNCKQAPALVIPEHPAANSKRESIQ